MFDKHKTPLLFLAGIYFILLSILVLFHPPQLFSVTDLPSINQAEFIIDSATTASEIRKTDWQKQALPDDWYLSQKKSSIVWYRANLTFDKNILEPGYQELWAIYVPSISHNASVYINNILIGKSDITFEQKNKTSHPTHPVSRHHNEPQFFIFPASIIKHKKNTVLIRVEASFYEQGLLDSFFIAPAHQLVDYYKKKYFYRVTLVEWGNVGLIALLLIIFPIWLLRPGDKKFAILSLILVFWVSHNLNLVVNNIPTSTFFWEAMTMATLGWTVVGLIIFNCYYLNARSPVVEKLLLLYAFSGLGLFLLPDIQDILHIGYQFWDGCLILIGSYGIYQIVTAFWQRNEKNAYPVLLAGITIIVFGLHDILLVNHLIDRRDGLIIQFTLFPALVVYSIILLNEFVQSMNRADELTHTLELRIEQKQKAIEKQYNELIELEKSTVLAEERERLMRDIHDGIGGHLVSILSMLDSKEMDTTALLYKTRRKVQNSLTDLRFVIDSLDPLLSDITTLLGMMRIRVTDQLEASGIQLVWNVSELPEFKQSSPRRSLHIMRIIQEVITNCIKHAQATQITVSTGTHDDKTVFIEIQDNGRGWKVDENLTNKKQHGMSNIRYRCSQIKAQLDIQSDKTGSRFRLLLNLS